MQNALSVIDRLIREHQAIRQNTAGLAQSISDDGAVKILAEIEPPGAKGSGDTANLARLLELLKSTAQGLDAHFNFEETGLMAAAERFGDRRLTTAFSTLFLQHEKLRNEFAGCERAIADLMNSRFTGRERGEKTKETQKQLNAAIEQLKNHAASEDILLRDLKKRLENPSHNSAR
jgi:chromosome segregation ATPase